MFRGVLAEALQNERSYEGFARIKARSHPLWRKIDGRLEHFKLRVLEEEIDLNAARPNVLRKFLRFGQQECPADQYVVFFYGHGYGPLGLFFDADAGLDDAKTMQLGGLADSVEALGDRAAVIVFRVLQRQHAGNGLPAEGRREVHDCLAVRGADRGHLALGDLPDRAVPGRRSPVTWPNPSPDSSRSSSRRPPTGRRSRTCPTRSSTSAEPKRSRSR